jgi:hypothetical protein
MINELDVVVLTRDIPDSCLVAGDLATVVMVYGEADGATVGYEIEVVAADGRTVALMTVRPDDVRARRAREILHVREVA